MPRRRWIAVCACLAVAPAAAQSCALPPAADAIWGFPRGLLILEGENRRPVLRAWNASCRELLSVEATPLVAGARRVSVADAAWLSDGRVALALSYDARMGRSGRLVAVVPPSGAPVRLEAACRALTQLAGGAFLCLESREAGVYSLVAYGAQLEKRAALPLPFRSGQDDPYQPGRIGLPQMLAGLEAYWLWLPAREALLEIPRDAQPGRWIQVAAPTEGRAVISFASFAGRLFALRPEASAQAERFDTPYRLFELAFGGWRPVGERRFARGARLAGQAADGVWVWDRSSRRAFTVVPGR